MPLKLTFQPEAVYWTPSWTRCPVVVCVYSSECRVIIYMRSAQGKKVNKLWSAAAGCWMKSCHRWSVLGWKSILFVIDKFFTFESFDKIIKILTANIARSFWHRCQNLELSKMYWILRDFYIRVKTNKHHIKRKTNKRQSGLFFPRLKFKQKVCNSVATCRSLRRTISYFRSVDKSNDWFGRGGKFSAP